MGLLSVETLDTRDYGTILDTWEIGGVNRKLKPPFKPYMYSLRPNQRGVPVKKRLLSDLQWHTIWKLEYPRCDWLDQDRNMNTIEDHFPFKQRIAVDVGFKFKGAYPKMLAWDIETKTAGISPNWRKDQITSIATWGDNGYQKCHVGDRRDVIPQFLAEYSKYNPDVLTDFFGRFYDLPCLIQNCQELGLRLPLGRDGSGPYVYTQEFEKHGRGRIENTVRLRGRVHFDVQKETDQDYTLTLAGLKDRGLKQVARYYGMNPIEVDYDKMDQLSTAQLVEYNLSDAKCTYELAQIYFRGLYELAEYLNIPIDMIVQRQPSHVGNIVLGREFQKQDIVSDGINKDRFPNFFNKKRACQGAIVGCYHTGIFISRKDLLLRHKDFHSMYPNTMRAFNLSPESVRLIATRPFTGKYNFEIKGETAIVEVPDSFQGQVIVEIDLSKDSITRQKMTNLLSLRDESKTLWKQTNDRQYWCREWAFKTVANSIYGYNIMVYSKYGNVLVGLVTTALDRLLIEKAMQEERTAGNSVLEVDTDGLFILEKRHIEFDATKYFPKQFKTEWLTQGTDDYEGIILMGQKGYVLLKDGKIKKHGSGILGRHIPPVIDDFVDELAYGLFAKEDPFMVMRKWHKDRLRGFDNKQFVSHVNLGKRPDLYNESGQYANLVAQLKHANINVQWGDRINFVKTIKGYTPTVLLQPNDKIDIRYYQTRMATIAAHMMQKPFGEIREFFDGLTKLEEFM